jgi:hypothetical protein
MDRMYDLKLGESFYINDIEILRVPGGWLYNHFFDHNQTTVFVPFSNEFMKPVL